MFGNGSLPITVDDVRCLTTFNRLIGTRAFYNNSAQTFTGPGKNMCSICCCPWSYRGVHFLQGTWRCMGPMET